MAFERALHQGEPMSFAAEDQLILLCSRTTLDVPAAKRASQLLRQPLDWDYILKASIAHGVAPLLRHGLTLVTEAQALVPAPVRQELDGLYLNNTARNRRLYNVVREICSAFDRAGLSVIALKDLALAKSIFPDMALRPMGDLDLLIRREEYDQVAQCMASLGFRPVPSSDCPYVMKYAWALHFRRAADNVWVDVQWGVLQLEWDIYGEGNFDFEIERLWHNAQPLDVQDFQIKAPKLEDMLFHLCMHLEGHHYAELILFCDIAELIRQKSGELDWNYLIALAKKYGVEASIYYTLYFTQQLLDCPLPPVLDRLAPPFFKADLFGPVFGNLTDLHVALDEIHRVARPPSLAMANMETIVRQQAASAMCLYRELDALTATLMHMGATVAIWQGAASERIFPSSALTPFAPLQLYVLEQEHSKLERALSMCGFKVASVNDAQVYDKSCAHESRDPALGGEPLVLRIRGQVIQDAPGALAAGAPENESKRSLAIKALRGAISSGPTNQEAQIDLIIASPEEIVFCLAARLGQSEHERLFSACSLIEFFRTYTGALDWQRVAHLSKQYEQQHAVGTGLLIASSLSHQPIMPEAAAGLCDSVQVPHLLEWARYGPESLVRYTHFKSLFYCVHSFLSVHGLRNRLAYLTQGKVLVNSLRYALEIGAHWLAAPQRSQKRLTIYDLAYWTEREPLASM